MHQVRSSKQVQVLINNITWSCIDQGTILIHIEKDQQNGSMKQDKVIFSKMDIRGIVRASTQN